MLQFNIWNRLEESGVIESLSITWPNTLSAVLTHYNQVMMPLKLKIAVGQNRNRFDCLFRGVDSFRVGILWNVGAIWKWGTVFRLGCCEIISSTPDIFWGIEGIKPKSGRWIGDKGLSLQRYFGQYLSIRKCTDQSDLKISKTSKQWLHKRPMKI